MSNITPPIFIIEDDDVIVFASVAKAEGWMEPIDVQLGEFEMYDSVGRLLKIETVKWKGNKVTSLEEQPTHQKELENALRRYLKASHVPQGQDPTCDLPCLVQACQKLG